jgi:hypothetical protein
MYAKLNTIEGEAMAIKESMEENNTKRSFPCHF